MSETLTTGIEKVILAAPRGYCAGVDRAVQTVERALDNHGAPIYVRKEIVHNKHVVEQLKAQGAVFVDELSDIPAGAMTIFSAHDPVELSNMRTRDHRLPARTAAHAA